MLIIYCWLPLLIAVVDCRKMMDSGLTSSNKIVKSAANHYSFELARSIYRVYMNLSLVEKFTRTCIGCKYMKCGIELNPNRKDFKMAKVMHKSKASLPYLKCDQTIYSDGKDKEAPFHSKTNKKIIRFRRFSKFCDAFDACNMAFDQTKFSKRIDPPKFYFNIRSSLVYAKGLMRTSVAGSLINCTMRSFNKLHSETVIRVPKIYHYNESWNLYEAAITKLSSVSAMNCHRVVFMRRGRQASITVNFKQKIGEIPAHKYLHLEIHFPKNIQMFETCQNGQCFKKWNPSIEAKKGNYTDKLVVSGRKIGRDYNHFSVTAHYGYRIIRSVSKKL